MPVTWLTAGPVLPRPIHPYGENGRREIKVPDWRLCGRVHDPKSPRRKRRLLPCDPKQNLVSIRGQTMVPRAGGSQLSPFGDSSFEPISSLIET